MAAIFGASIHQYEQYVGLALSEVDQEYSYEAFVQALIDLKFGAGISNSAFVSDVYVNVDGGTPDTATLSYFASFLDRGELPQAAFGVLAADHPQNALNIDLVGLTRSGLDYA